MTHGLDTSFLLAVEIVEYTHHAEALRLLGELLARGDRVFWTLFYAADRHARRLESFESEHRPDSLFYPAMVLLDYVV